MSVEDAKATLASLEGKLQDLLDRRGKTAHEIAVVGADGVGTRGSNSAMKLAPLNKQVVAIDADIGLLRIKIRHAQQALKLQQAGAENVKARQAAANGETGRLVQLEIRAPDGRVLRQFHKSVDVARTTLQPGYEVIGQVIGSGVVSPLGRSFMASLLDAHGDVLMEWLEARGIIGAEKQTVVVLPANGRENMQ